MPLIQPEKKTTNEQLNVTLSSETLQELRAYGRFLNNSSVSYVLTQLIATLGRDKEFQQWKAAQTGLGFEPLAVRPQKEHANGKSA
jgi:post-segregation antitoxin (ccd killing protein)